MSLLDEFRESFVIMEKSRVPDGEGGYTTTYSAGGTIKMATQFDTSMEARKAEKDGVTSTFTFLAPKNCGLSYHDVVKRESDGQYFRLTCNPNEKSTPSSASFDLTAITAEKWEITT